ncbi:hypothetical protein [Paraburkholderia adhaesiva]|uniref:hypothetical protein n=1 Tax=Paraburkholderia adhaesiva TaxID=2883244 RepID=UPI001F198CF5|nr:hypothetical protein [Paraburkholderia adhaesiva]
MSNFLLTLALNLLILATLLGTCYVVNQMWPGTNADGYLAFAVFIIFAAILDAVLTFLVFAESHAHYGQFSTTETFDERLASYFAAAGIALYCACRRGRTLTGSLLRNRQPLES